MIVTVPDIPGKCNGFSVVLPVERKNRWACEFLSEFSDACYALELNGWKLWSENRPPMNLPVLLMHPEWGTPKVVVPSEYPQHRYLLMGLYWKLTGIADEELSR